jgi:uncharacterized protein
MRVTIFTDAERFHKIAWPLLTQHEAENNLLLGIISDIQRGVYENPLMAAAFDGDNAVMVAIRTPPRYLLLSTTDHPNALIPLLDAIYAASPAIPGVIAPVDLAARAADFWTEHSGETQSIGLEMRIYQADTITPPADVPGAARLITETDRDLLRAWVRGFQRDALNAEIDAEELECTVAQWLTNQPGISETYLWIVDDKPVSIAKYSGGAPNGCRVSGVYTPPAQRRHGYGTAITAAVSTRILELGKQYGFLFTDLANPTSNSIYQQIGYRPVVDVNRVDFSGA